MRPGVHDLAGGRAGLGGLESRGHGEWGRSAAASWPSSGLGARNSQPAWGCTREQFSWRQPPGPASKGSEKTSTRGKRRQDPHPPVPTVTKGLAQEELTATCAATASKVPIVKAMVFPGAIMDVSWTIKQAEQ